MKTLYLIYSRIKQYFLNNRVLFLLFLLGGVLNAVMVIYSYGNLLPVVFQRNTQEWDNREYSIRFDDLAPELERVKMFSNHPLITACAYEVEEGVSACDLNYPLEKTSGTLEFTEPYQMIVPYGANKSVGDTVVFCDETFTVIGTAVDFYGGNIYIPYDTFVKIGCAERITRIKCFSAQRQEFGDDKVVALIDEMLPENTHVGGAANHIAKDDVEISEFMLCLIITNAFLAVLAYLFLLRYIVDSQMAENLVSLILGASKSQIILCIFWESMILALVANGAGLLGHWLLYEKIFIHLNVYSDLSYRAGDYFLCIW